MSIDARYCPPEQPGVCISCDRWSARCHSVFTSGKWWFRCRRCRAILSGSADAGRTAPRTVDAATPADPDTYPDGADRLDAAHDAGEV